MNNAIKISRTLYKLSSKSLHIYNKKYDTYNQAVNNILEDRGLTQKWLVERIIEKDQKKASLQSMMSRWLSQGDPIGEGYQKKINNALNISVDQYSDGKWHVTRTDPGLNNSRLPDDNIAEPGEKYNFTIDELLKEERSRLDIEDIPDTETGRALRDILDDAVSLVLKLRRLVEKEKRRSSGDE